MIMPNASQTKFNQAWSSSRLGFKNNLDILILAILTAVLSWHLKPTVYLASLSPKLELEKTIPSQIGQWQEVKLQTFKLVTPGQQILEEDIYSEVLERVYDNPQGYRIMLSIAYGNDQRDGLNLHKPTICYPAQGFEVTQKQKTTLQFDQTSVKAERMVAKFQSRIEPVTFWSIIGQHSFSGGLDKKIKEMGYGLKGQIADGMLIRVSSIDDNTQQAYQQQQAFINDFVNSLPVAQKARFIGANHDL